MYRSLMMVVMILLGVLPATWVVAGSDKRFEMRDGAVISGQLVGVEGDVYLVDSPTLGRLRIHGSDLRSMVNPANAPSPLAGIGQLGGVDFSGLVDQTKQRIMADPALQQEVQALAGDPELMALISDPGLMRLIMSGDLNAMQNDPRLQQLLHHPALQGLVGRLRLQP